jgi:hypothetical protein
MKRALVTLPEGVWQIIYELKGTVGDSDSEVIRHIVIAHLSERGLLIPSYKIKGIPGGGINEQLRYQNKMILALAELLADRGLIKLSEWRSKISQRVSSHSN